MYKRIFSSQYCIGVCVCARVCVCVTQTVFARILSDRITCNITYMYSFKETTLLNPNVYELEISISMAIFLDL